LQDSIGWRRKSCPSDGLITAHVRSLSDNPFENRDIHRLEAGGQVEATKQICRPHGNPGDQDLRVLDDGYDRVEIGTFASAISLPVLNSLFNSLKKGLFYDRKETRLHLRAKVPHSRPSMDIEQMWSNGN